MKRGSAELLLVTSIPLGLVLLLLLVGPDPIVALAVAVGELVYSLMMGMLEIIETGARASAEAVSAVVA